MGRRERYPDGTFNWVDLATTDREAAAAFYRDLFGWSVETMPDGSYGIFQRDGAPVAGLAELPAEQREAGVPPSWSSFVRVGDADAVAARAGELGATTRVPPFDIEGAGRMAVVADPQGAVLVLWQPAGFEGAAIVNEPGALTWNDVQTTDVEGARDFYGRLFGWAIEETPGSDGRYFTITNGGRANGGLMPLPPGLDRPYWMAYFATDDLEAALQRVRAGGGAVLVEPMAVGPGGRFAVAADPQGAVFSLFAGEFDD